MNLDGITWIGPPLDPAIDLDDLPVALAGLLRQINGFILRGGALHVRGVVEDPAWHALRPYWNGTNALATRYRALEANDVPFAQDCVGDQFFLREGRVWRLLAETDDLEPLEVDLFAFLDAASHDPVEYLGAQPLLALHDEGGHLEPGELIFAYPPLCTNGADLRLRAVPADELLDLHAALAARIRDLPDGAELRFDVTE